MIIRMTSPARPQQRYDHWLRDLVQRTKDATIATNLGVPRSTARGWLREAPKIVVCLDVTDLKASELRQEVQASALLTYRQGTPVRTDASRGPLPETQPRTLRP
jgi:hypothetical protein